MTTPDTKNSNNSIEELFREYKETGSPEVRNKIVEEHFYLADILARKYTGRGIDYEDLYQVASYALVLAVSRFDPDKGAQFVSFATPTVIGEIKKYFRDTMWSLKVPRRLKEISMKIIEAKERLHEENDRAPTVPELAAHLSVSEDDILEAIESGRAYTAFSLDQESDDGEDGDGAMMEKYLGNEEKGYERLEISAILEKVMDGLTQTEKEVIRKRFLHEITQKEVADALGVSQMTVSRIEKAMREKFRREYHK